MTFRRRLCLGVGAALCLVNAAAQQLTGPCRWFFPDAGYEFDLSPITSAGPYPYTVSSSERYMFNFCADITSNPCPPSNTVAPSIQLPPQGSGCLTVFGLQANTAVSLLSADATSGMVLTYKSDTQCGFNDYYSTTFNVQCDKTATSLVISSFAKPTSCSLQYNIRSTAACPTPKLQTVAALGAGWIVFIVGLVGATVYFAGGMVYKRTIKGASGWEGVPNIDFWRSVRAYVCCEGRGGGRYAHAELYDTSVYTATSSDGAVTPTVLA